ncbi:hypothetical protein BbiDN127_A0027 (plasmid) [Borreliella bissettiae DN127]|uniref:Uncharacterized protein n=1 Tax=Borrelia bissettiae (strain DSM 17990 / CIP 109136 / DN127) TaxID=521010 RepID=G0APF2_BORBD|nr:hypothetical protein BbiDN127_A0027 [Borreliella bissettiae DN127]
MSEFFYFSLKNLRIEDISSKLFLERKLFFTSILNRRD